MNYYQWQKIHTKAYTTKPKLKKLTLSTPTAGLSQTSEEMRSSALGELEKLCSVQQLEKLRQLAERFNKGLLFE